MRLGASFFIVVFLSAAGTPGWSADPLLDEAQGLFRPLPGAPPTLEGNPPSPERTELGRMLFFEPRLSASQLISCNTCHNLGLGGADLQETSVGHGWQRGPRNAPTVLNAVFNKGQFWDGRAKDLREQAKGPMQAAPEMSNTPERIVQTLRGIPQYVRLFRAAFPATDDPLTFDNVAAALELFEATLLTPNSRFDEYLKGSEQALSGTEKDGLKIFLDIGCATCHSGINVGGRGYYAFGVKEKPEAAILPPEDKGRFAVTKVPSDEYSFRVPSLRNVELTSPYFHSGKVWQLGRAIQVMARSQLGASLSSDQTTAVMAFLRTLTGTQPRVEVPILPPGTDATPRPVLGSSGGT